MKTETLSRAHAVVPAQGKAASVWSSSTALSPQRNDQSLGTAATVDYVKDRSVRLISEINAELANRMPTGKTILVAEDDLNDVFLLKIAFQKAGINVRMNFVQDGEQAIEYLKSGNEQENPVPDLLLLDLKMPRVSGFEVLEWIRQQPGLKRMLTVVMTSSDEPRDINRAYDLGANSYLVKPSDLANLMTVAQHLQNYWMDLNRRPDFT